MMRTTKVLLLAVLAAGVTAATAASARAGELVTNGGFEQTTNGPGQFDLATTATGWTSSGYNFIFASGAADTTGSVGSFGALKLWGPSDGSANGLPAASPDGGNFVAADGAFETAAIKQTVGGLTAGHDYNVSFWWAGAQQEGFTGPTTEQWQVSLGGQTQATAVVQNVNHGFTGWQKQTLTFTANASSEVLSFLAVGTPDGLPPFSLLDGVSMTAAQVPEPAAWAVMLVGLAGIGAAAGWRRRSGRAG